MSSPSSTRRSRSHSMTSPTNPPSKRAFSVAASPRQMLPRGKRARRSSSSASSSSSSSSRPQPILIPAASSPGPFSVLSSPTPLAAIRTNLTCSAPPTPLVASSAAFFPSARSSQRDADMNPPSSPSPRNPHTNLDALHREAFTSLRHSVAESGEGFVRRMREWEQQRRAEISKASMLGNERERDKRRDRYGVRKGRVTRMDHRTIGGSSLSNTEIYRSDSYHRIGKSRATARSTLPFGGQADTDDEDDIMIDGTGQLAFDVSRPQKKRRPVSHGDVPMDVTSPGLYDVEIADSDGETYSTTSLFNSTTFDFPFTYSHTRSSSPFSFANTSDDESYAHTHSGSSSPRGTHRSLDWSTNLASSRIHVQRTDVPEQPTRMSLLEHTSRRDANPSQSASEKAMAALVLALSNGSGSLADYGSVREAQGDLEELEAGALWD